MRQVRTLFLLWLPLIGYMMAIFFLSTQVPSKKIPFPFPFPNFFHIVEYLILALLMFRAVNGGFQEKIRVKTSAIVACFSLIYAISDEFHQSFIPGRNADSWDVLADFVGIVAGLMVIFALQRRRKPFL